MAALLVGMLLLAGATSAQAQDDPYATTEQAAKENDLDTDLTPVTKGTELWAQLHGAPYRETEVLPGSATRFDTELVAVSFRNPTIGLAGGSACAIEPVMEPDEESAEFGARAAECRGTDENSVPRTPALYRYSEPPDSDPLWEELELPGGGSPGYIGAITWIDSNRALIVGGTGSYPARELGPGEEDQYGRSNSIADPTDPAKADEAGEARAWIYTRSPSGEHTLEELDLSAFTEPEGERAGMRGLTAVDCYEDPNPGQDRFGTPDPNEPEIELCFAGGLGQIWEFRDGEFTGKRVDAQSPSEELKNASLLRFRVREIVLSVKDQPAYAFAVTSGCCVAGELENTPRILLYNDEPKRWFAYSMNDRAGAVAHNPALEQDEIQEANEARQQVNANPELPDSLYSVTVKHSSGEPDLSVIASPGGPESSGERPSVISRPSEHSKDTPAGPLFFSVEPFQDLLRSPLATARLVAGDGDTYDTDGVRPTGVRAGWGDIKIFPNGISDGVPDWAVGESRSTELQGLGARGLIVATALPPTIQDSVNEGRGTTPPSAEELAQNDWKPFDQEKADAYRRSRYFSAPSYSLNDVAIAGDDEVGWAVGSHGAILRYSPAGGGAGGGATDEPKPPRLGARRSVELSDAEPYESAPAGHPAGEVPQFGDETVKLPEPRMVPMGPAPPGQMVMSRDASEGWAIDENTFSYFDGTRWTRCDQDGVPGLRGPDPACEAMAPLREFRKSSGQLASAPIRLAARVPLEYDTDPTNDDELEIVAIGSNYRGPEYDGETLPAVVRYRDGRWRFDKAMAASLPEDPVVELVFTAPDDGWAVERHSDNGGRLAFVHRFDGTAWHQCTGSETCDPGGRLPELTQELVGLTVAGERVYLYGNRNTAPKDVGAGTPVGHLTDSQPEKLPANRTPLILYRDPDGNWTDGSGAGEDEAGLDPGFQNPQTEEIGVVESLSVVQGGGGEFEGWAVGSFGGGQAIQTVVLHDARVPPARAVLMRLDPSGRGGWQVFRSPGPLEDYMLPGFVGKKYGATAVVTYPSAAEPDGTFIGQRSESGFWGGRLFRFNGARERFELVRTGRPQEDGIDVAFEARPVGDMAEMAPDGQGGIWLNSSYLFRFTDEAPAEIFTEAPDPFGPRDLVPRDLARSPDGAVWAATGSDRLLRRDPVTGWEEIRVPGWEPGRVVTRAARAEAIDFGPGGEGLVVGEGGRIAAIAGNAVALDPAAGTSCALGDPIPCGTSRDLKALDIAPDGSAIATGERLAVLWRPAGGEFRVVKRPAILSSTTITAVSFPTPTRAYLATNQGVVFRGDMSGTGSWSWRAENRNDAGEEIGGGVPLRDIAVGGDGHGYAVGDQGTVLERTGEDAWRALETRNAIPGNLTEVEFAADGGSEALIGGQHGTILAARGEDVYVVRPPDFFVEHQLTGEVVGFAYAAGESEGSADVWAALGQAGSLGGRLLRHQSHPPERASDAAGAPLGDAPDRVEGEMAIAAFGKSDCDRSGDSLCSEMTATTTTNEVISERITAELAGARGGDELDVSVFSGDATDSAGRPGASPADTYEAGLGQNSFFSTPTQEAGALKHRRFEEFVVDELEEKGVPLLAATGGQDLSENVVCGRDAGCHTTKQFAEAGENYAWRDAFAGQGEPWGDGSGALEAAEEGEINLEPAPGTAQNSVRIEDQRADADGKGGVPEAEAGIGGANTHYAVDAVRDGEAIARIVFVDTSMRSLAASDPLQQPHELGGGQQRFLERMICEKGQSSTFGDRCTREKVQKAIVVSNTPTYSYGPGALTHTATDATTFEATMLRYGVDLVISGALGYNGLYYTLAAGLHEPCPGDGHPEGPPTGKTPDCLDAATSAAGANTPDPNELASVINDEDLRGAYPTLIASGAGGKFGPDGNEGPSGSEGRWHGYSVARLLPDGDIVVEQRPILDWIGLEASRHMIRPREKLLLNGYGRSPISTTIQRKQTRAFHYEISTAAITHRYDLLRADPEEPWLPLEDSAAGAQADGAEACEGYVCLPDEIATIDSQSGQVKAGSGKHPPTYALAMLSVGEEVATTPLYFEPSPSFRFEAPTVPRPIPALGSVTPPGSPTTPPTPSIPNVSVPTPPVPPALVPPPPAPPATPPQPPVPPPVPPASAGPSALSLSFAPTGLVVAPTASVIPPPAPPINPAPPGGARKEARQRQAATQKSGADNAESSGDAQELGGDSADGREGPHGSAMTRRAEPGGARQEHSFMRLERASSGEPAVAWGAGITLAALVLAAGFTTLTPRSRRRQPEVPAPARAWGRPRR